MSEHFSWLGLWNPVVWGGVFLLGWVLRRYTGPGPRPRWWLGLGLLALLAAFGTPIQVAAEHSLTAAMGQRLLTTGVAVPLLLAALAPTVWRSWMRRVPMARVLTYPLVALVLFNGAYVVTAVPSVWDWLSLHPLAFWPQNVGFLGLAVLFWWPVLSPLRELPRLHPLLSLGYLFVGGIALTPLFVFWSLTSHVPAYPVDVAGAHLLGLSPMADERVGGLVMKAGALLSYGIVFVGIFWRWWEEGLRGSGPDGARTARAPLQLEDVRRRRAVKEENS